MLKLKDTVKDDHGYIGIVEVIDPEDKQHPDAWALVDFPTCPDPKGSQWIQLKYLQRVN